MLPKQAPEQTQQKQGGMDYISNVDLNSEPQEFEVMDVKLDTENQYGARVVIKMYFQRRVRFWGVKLPTKRSKNPNYDLLLEEWGEDEQTWIGKKGTLHLAKDRFSEQYFARVGFPVAEAPLLAEPAQNAVPTAPSTVHATKRK